tara:strand:- start:6274 stop:7902 length:1629 start_codon:yes stop_codon:yes gene_type:complete
MENTKLPPEMYRGNTEYKKQLLNLSSERIEELRTQMHYRIYEGSGEAIYRLGVLDNGTQCGISPKDMEESIANLHLIANNKFTITEIDRINTSDGNIFAYFLIREDATKALWIEISILVAGNVDSGKSTLIGVLTRGINDDGRGLARSSVAQHPHEIITGRTSSVSYGNYVGFNNKGECLNDLIPSRKLQPIDVVKRSSKIATFFDMAGHQKYLRTTIAGFSSSEADYALIIICIHRGVTNLTIEHIGLCLCFRIPFMIIVTKVDTPEEEQTKQLVRNTKTQIRKTLKKLGVTKVPYFIQKDTIMLELANKLKDDIIVPILRISNVTGRNIDRLKAFINLLPKRTNISMPQNVTADKNAPLHFSIKESFLVTSVGVVVCGFIHSGTAKVNDKIQIGPDSTGKYYESSIRSIHIKRIPASEASHGQWACFAIRNVPRDKIIKGMVAIPITETPKKIYEFYADVSIIYGSCITIREGYEPVLNMGNIMQTAQVLSTGNVEVLRAGDHALLHLRFSHRPCYICVGDVFVFREGKVCGSGKITKLC